MTLKWQIVVSLAATLSFFTVSYPYRSVDAGPAGPVFQATGPAGIVFLDTGNGTISYCTNPVLRTLPSSSGGQAKPGEKGEGEHPEHVGLVWCVEPEG